MDSLTQLKDNSGNTTNYNYDLNNNIGSLTEKVNGLSYTTSYGYDKDNKQTSMTYNRDSSNSISYAYDSLARKTTSTVNTGSASFNTIYSYLPGANGSTTTKIGSISNNNSAIGYTYDANGNIDTITNPGDKTIQYYYNEANELTREDNKVLNKTIVYVYDGGGNITTKTEYAYTTDTNPTNPTSTVSYQYGDNNWKDKLTSYNGKNITYDSIGNPLSYDIWNYTWDNGRQLSTATSTGGKNISYKYNSAGIRTSKTVNGVTTSYHLSGDKVTYEDNGTDKIYYTYDSNGNLVSFSLNGVEYYYIRNAQGDIIGLFDKTGAQVVSYTYDSWGKLISIKDQNGTDITNVTTHVGYKNPYRYRGYRYDTETGLYYLQSRYYNPEWGRFINADGYLGTPGELLSHNLFAYCGNNPVNRDDFNGGNWGAIVAGAGAVLALPAEVAAVVTVGAVVLVTAVVYCAADVAIQEYRNHHVTYADSSSDATSNPVSDAMEKRIPNSELNPPKARGEKPISKKDGKPIEIHHKGQNPAGPFEELARTDHRLGENYRKNHPNFREKSKIDRDKFAKDVNKYWKLEWDSGRWSSK